MSEIRILPEILSNKIAAGEVVERPASVVKELVENALDAGSTRIIIEVEQGGRSLVRVSDNGVGMGHDDALLAIERYATSKIRKDEDLFAITTLGFRGEALPSIAAVSRLTLETREADADAGTRIELAGGKISRVSEVGAPPGTLISVRQLFFNTPARRKFMKTAGTEMGHIGDIVANIALGWPQVQFRLIHNGRPVRSWQAVTDPADRVADVLGQNLRNDLHPLESGTEAISMTGWIGAPHTARRTSRGIYIYVNGRFVRDRMVQHALSDGCSGRLMKGQFPLAVLFITVPPDQVDVNVHPAKNEVRFSQQKAVHRAVAEAVARTLQEADRPTAWPGARQPGETDPERPVIQDTKAAPEMSVEMPEIFRPGSSRISEPLPDYAPAEAVPDRTAFHETPSGHMPVSPKPGQTEIWQKGRFGDLRVIGQFRGTYILCESENGLILIDQHAAHERVVFEQLKQRAAGSQAAAQTLLIPETVDLSWQEAASLEKLIPEFRAFGFDIEPFGGNTFVVKAVPALLSGRPVCPLIAQIAEKAAELGQGSGPEKALEDCLILMACHGAIRANQLLSEQQMQGLLKQMDRCENPSHCPHGRPTWIRWTTGFLEKSFRRVV
ncbi:DNA mismatch repair protein MutL [Desulfonema ishimotonii]|uniref:DNA mismatch repair protein MutL n=1 Tax=Desulfonema ishimotonii TaxID=45657 RepID=A0A401G108_9BACT|nr:DNA mismatch repair endonuclease MutL [Desulfonema ishimotonii]GBC62873.1 DNA mismatch repair protein MutL [Desulfonema ishimotonii]